MSAIPQTTPVTLIITKPNGSALHYPVTGWVDMAEDDEYRPLLPFGYDALVVTEVGLMRMTDLLEAENCVDSEAFKFVWRA